MQANDEEFLGVLLKKVTGDGHVLPDEYSRLTSLFTQTVASSTRAKAYLVLSSVCEHHRRSSQLSTAEDDAGTHNILHSFLPSVESRLAEIEERPLLEALSFIAALFAVDWRTASAMFARDGFQDSMMDALDLFPSSTALPKVVANVLSSACGYKSCRASLSPRCLAWLQTVFHHASDAKLKAATTLALLKYSQSSEAEGAELGDVTGEAGVAGEEREYYYKTLRDIILCSCGNVKDIADAVEGLAYLSTKPSVKALIADDDDLLKTVVSLRSSFQRKAATGDDFGTTPFGLAVLIANLCSYRPQLSEEQAQIERLKRMAQPGAKKGQSGGQGAPEENLDDDEHVRSRAVRLVAVGVTDLLVSIARATESAATRMVVGKAFLGLVEDQRNRGKILQSGGAKILMMIIRASQQQPDAKSTSPLANMEFTDLLSIQALAKLAITSSPMQVFGPSENASIDAIKPLACLLLHNSSTLLQRFEAIMALTNIASAGPELSDRIARADGVLSKAEFLMLEENQLVRRAASELICNLVAGSELVFNRYSGDGSGSSESSDSFNQSKSRLHVLIALADVEDDPTRLAASGALAVLTGSPTASRLVVLLELEHHRVFPVLRQLIDPSEQDGENDPNPGFVHRGVVCIRNILINQSDDALRSKLGAEAVQHGIVEALTNVLKSAGKGNVTEAVLRPAAEALKWLVDSGVNISVLP